jgi:hypothetical protein
MQLRSGRRSARLQRMIRSQVRRAFHGYCRKRTCKKTVMSGRIKAGFVILLNFRRTLIAFVRSGDVVSGVKLVRSAIPALLVSVSTTRAVPWVRFPHCPPSNHPNHSQHAPVLLAIDGLRIRIVSHSFPMMPIHTH